MRRFCSLIALTLALGCACRPQSDQLDNKALAASIDKFVTTKMSEEHLPGVAVVVVQNGKTVFQRGWGVAHVEKKTPVDAGATMFRVGSVTKVLTALVTARLADQGRIDLRACQEITD